MKPDRRRSGIVDRRKLRGMKQQQGRLATEPSWEESARSQENALLVREEKVHEREDAVHQRETKALLREESAASREQEIHDERASKAAQQDRNVKLRQANEQLVIASIQLQIATEEIGKSKAEMTRLATHDPLTGLPNRIQFYDRIVQAMAFAKRHPAKLAVLFLDLDRFKIVNDTMGHAIGDQLLQAVAQRLQSAIRSTDTVSRQGGDEFVLLLSEVGPEETLALKVEKIHEIITAPYSIAGNDLHIGATIGISIFPEDGEDTETLIRHADAAMYYAKKSGRNKYQFFEQEMRTREVERQGLEASLYQALDQRQFVLFYQAQINLGSGVITGAEALIRWRHPSRGLLLPEWFVPVAEECGAIVPIGHWVLREACRQAKAWLNAGLTLDVIAVNISAREFENDDFLDNVCSVLRETGLAPDRLELELTETVLMKYIDCTRATLAALRSMGVRISIDDFGTGYSSLNYLKQFPIDTIKIDQSFVREITAGDDDILANAIIGIGKSLRYQVVAEGVESPQQLAFLRENHCAAVQGRYLNAPMIAGEFGAVLKQGIPENILNSYSIPVD